MTTRNDNGPQGYCGFVVGQHVVCIDNVESHVGWHARNRVPFGLVRGRVYTIARIYTGDGFYRGVRGKRVNLELVELKKKPSPCAPNNNGFAAARFRPLPKLRVEDFLAASTPKDVVSA